MQQCGRVQINITNQDRRDVKYMKSLESIGAAKRTIFSVARNTLGHARPFFRLSLANLWRPKAECLNQALFPGPKKELTPSESQTLLGSSRLVPDVQKQMLQCGFEMGLCPTVTTLDASRFQTHLPNTSKQCIRTY